MHSDIGFTLLPFALRVQHMQTTSGYSLVGKMAEGGMAEIFLAHQLGAHGFTRPVVLKRIRPALVADKQFRNMLIDEAHIAMRLRHSSIVQVLDFQEANEQFFLVMELVDGFSLDQLIRRAREQNFKIPLEMALHVVSTIAVALDYAHKAKLDGKPLNIVHRDVSPHNILVSREGEIKLTDFGIAQAQFKLEQTGTGIVKGKVSFMSPEQANASSLDNRSDIFSLGTVLYFLATGELPFREKNAVETMHKVRLCEFSPPKLKRGTLNEDVSRIIMKAMSARPDDRYDNAEQMHLEISQVLREQFSSFGALELKRWLEALAKKDKAPTGAEFATQNKPDEELVLPVGTSNILPPTNPSQSRKSVSKLFYAVLIFLAIGVAAFAFLKERSGIDHTNQVTAPLPEVRNVVETDAGQTAEVAIVDASVVTEKDAGALAIVAPETVDDGAVIESVDDAGIRVSQEEIIEAAPEPIPVPEPTPAPVEKAETPKSTVGKKVVVAPTKTSPPRRPSATPTAKKTVTKKIAPPPGTVSVRLISEPPGAAVRIDRKIFGTTPLPLRFRTGIIFRVEFLKEGYAMGAREFLVRPQEGQRIWIGLTRTRPKSR